MSKPKCPAGCGKRFVSDTFARSHADFAHPGWNSPTNVGQRGWATPYGFGDFTDAITYEGACERMKAVVATIAWPKSSQMEDGADNA